MPFLDRFREQWERMFPDTSSGSVPAGSGFNPSSGASVPNWWERPYDGPTELDRQWPSPRETPSNPNYDPSTGNHLPDFRYAEPNTTESDIAASMMGQQYGQYFRDMADQFGGYQERAFDIYEQSMSEDGGLDWGRIGDTSNQMALAQNRWMFEGTANTEGSLQNAIGNALRSSGQFGAGAALANATMNMGDRWAEANLKSADRNLGLIGGIEQADLASKRQVSLSGVQSFTRDQLGAGEAAASMDTWAADLGFNRSLARYDEQRTQDLMPYIERALTPPSWGQQMLENMGARTINDLYEMYGPEAVDWFIGQVGGLIGGGGDGSDGRYGDPDYIPNAPGDIDGVVGPTGGSNGTGGNGGSGSGGYPDDQMGGGNGVPRFSYQRPRLGLWG